MKPNRLYEYPLCPRCNGERVVTHPTGTRGVNVRVGCPRCRGTGWERMASMDPRKKQAQP